MNNIDISYQELLQDILDNGVVKGDRTGVGTKSVFGRTIRHKMSDGFPLLTTKKMYWKGIVAELIWFLRGDTDIRYLWDNNVHIWDVNWYQMYEKSCSSPYSLEEMQFFANNPSQAKYLAKEVWDCGPIYGKQWRNWEYADENTGEMCSLDQMGDLVDMLKNSPDSRRLMVSAWNPPDVPNMSLPPCHYGFQCWTRELTLQERVDLIPLTYDKYDPFDFGITPDGGDVTHEQIDELYPVPKRAISLQWTQRSVDTLLGLPFNIASYALLLELLAKECNMVADEVIGQLGDTHIYLNHLEQVQEQIKREPFNLPEMTIDDKMSLIKPDDMEVANFKISNYEYHAAIKGKLN